MTRSSRPYLARALYEWLLDNDLTPYLVVDATWPGVEVPRQFVQNGQIVLNASPTAVRDFFMENQAVGFSARFGGQPTRILVPMEALLAVYGKENGAGMVFGHEPELEAGDDAPDEAPSTLSSVPDDSNEAGTEEKADSPAGGDKSDADADGSGKKRPSLRVVK